MTLTSSAALTSTPLLSGKVFSGLPKLLRWVVLGKLEMASMSASERTDGLAPLVLPSNIGHYMS